jgi:hypothetical protein
MWKYRAFLKGTFFLDAVSHAVIPAGRSIKVMPCRAGPVEGYGSGFEKLFGGYFKGEKSRSKR